MLKRRMAILLLFGDYYENGIIQFQQSFTPMAVSKPNVYPQGFMTRIAAGQACSNAGKRLCTREEWYRACAGNLGLLQVRAGDSCGQAQSRQTSG